MRQSGDGDDEKGDGQDENGDVERDDDGGGDDGDGEHLVNFADGGVAADPGQVSVPDQRWLHYL